MPGPAAAERFAPRSKPGLSIAGMGLPPLIVREEATTYEISADMCGLTPDDVMAHVSGRVLTILGDELLGDDDEIPLALHHVVLLPFDADIAKSSVRCANGRFLLSVPRT